MKPTQNLGQFVYLGALLLFASMIATTGMAATPTGSSLQASLDADASHIAFTSSAPDVSTSLLPGRNIYIHNARTDSITVIGRESVSAQANVDHFNPAISPDGRHVAFQSRTSGLEPDQDSQSDIYLTNLKTGATTLISVNAEGSASGSGKSTNPIFSPDGRFILFTSFADDLVENDSNGKADLFLYELETDSVRLVSISQSTGSSATGAPGLHAAESPAFSRNGEFIAFESRATNLADKDSSPNTDIYLHEIETGTNELITVAAGGEESAETRAHSPIVNTGGRFVLFKSEANNLTSSPDTHTGFFLRDRQEAATRAIPVWGPMSADGRYIAFGPGLRWDREQDTYDPSPIDDYLPPKTEEPSIPNSARRFSRTPLISPDGQYVAFLASFAPPDGTSSSEEPKGFQIYIRDFSSDRSTLVTQAQTEGPHGRHDVMTPVVDSEWSKLAFYTRHGGLVQNDANEAFDVFTFDLEAEQVSLVSKKRGSDGFARPKLSIERSADGVELAWTRRSIAPAAATTLIPNYEVEQSSDLQTWTATDMQVQGGSDIPEDRVRFELSPTATTFFRLGLELPAFTGLQLSGTFLPGANLAGHTFDEAQLTGATLDRSAFDEASFTGTDLRLAGLRQVTAPGAQLSGANLSGAVLTQANLEGADLTNAGADSATFSGAILADATLIELQASGSTWNGADLRNAVFNGAGLTRANFSGIQGSSTSFVECTLTVANFSEADLQGADFTNADLFRADFRNADLTDADFTNADLRVVDFRGATLSSTTFEGATFQRTVMPDGTTRNEAP